MDLMIELPGPAGMGSTAVSYHSIKKVTSNGSVTKVELYGDDVIMTRLSVRSVLNRVKKMAEEHEAAIRNRIKEGA